MAQNSESDYRLLPSFILSTRSVLNPINHDLKSFGHAIVFAHHPTDWHARRRQPAKGERLIQHVLDKIKYPVLPCKIPKLENQLRIRINLLFVWRPIWLSAICDVYLQKRLHRRIQYSLLGWTICLDKTLFSTVLRYNEVWFFMMIVMLFHFYYMTISLSNNSKMYFCTRCLKHFKEQKTLQQHRWYCKK